jgi:hypothetical protein
VLTLTVEVGGALSKVVQGRARDYLKSKLKTKEVGVGLMWYSKKKALSATQYKGRKRRRGEGGEWRGGEGK